MEGTSKDGSAPSTPVKDDAADGAQPDAKPKSVPGLALPPPSASSTPRERTQYRVVPRVPRFDPNLPPRVITNAELEAARSALQFIDAMAVEREEAEADPEMAAFLPMLKEYLKRESAFHPPPSTVPRFYPLGLRVISNS